VVGACQSAETSWRVLSGPSLRLAAGGGSTIDLQTTQLDLSMAGEQLVIEWSADAGPGNSATETRVVDIGVDPFVEVRARTTPLLRREESAFTFEITLTNTTDCAVDGLQLVVPLSQGTPLLETAQVDGVRADAQLQNDTLVLSNLALEARGQRVLRVAAKPKLLASPTVQPAVTLRGLPVSIDVAAPTPAGCGCSTTGPEWLLVALFAVARRRRRE
jgi:MYXO-CTERM domain-containing protein